MNNENLIPIKLGEKRALKARENRKTERIPIQVTKSRKAQLVARAGEAKLSLSAYLLEGK